MALLRCPDCGRDVSDAAPACPGCGRPMTGGLSPTTAPRVQCPKCGSAQLSDQRRGFSAGRAVGGGLLFGGIGLLAGMFGSRRVMLTCMNCGTQWAAGDQPKSKRSSGVGCLVVFLVLVGIGAIRSACDKGHATTDQPASVAATPPPAPSPTTTTSVDLASFLLQYGKPDVDDSTAFDKPQPPIVTRWLVFKREHVRATFVPDGPPTVGGRLAQRWNLVAYQDDRTNQPITPAEAASRLKARSISGQ